MIVVLICISLTANDVEHTFMGLFTIGIFFLMKAPFRCFVPFLNRVLFHGFRGSYFLFVFFNIPWIQMCCYLCDLPILFLVCALFFCSLGGVFLRVRMFNFDKKATAEESCSAHGIWERE